MAKFNGFENWFITTAVKAAVAKAENDVIEAEKGGKRLIYAQGYFTMVGKDILDHIDELTVKSAIKERDGK